MGTNTKKMDDQVSTFLQHVGEGDEKPDKPKPTVVEGLLLPPQMFGVPWEQHINDIRNLTLRDDDVFLCAYPKAGTHWMWEVMSMLQSNAVKYDERAKEHMMIEFSTKERLDAAPSPRILNTHLPFSMLPVASIKEKQIKLVHVYRNPKDIAVSLFFHKKQMYPETTLQSTIKVFINGSTVFGSQMEYLRQMEQFMNDNPDHPICSYPFEEAKRRPVETVKRLAQFLEVAASDQLCDDIADACSFKKLKEADKNKSIPEGPGKTTKLQMNFYRKGEVGDWKNHLTVADSEALDEYISEGLRGLTKFPMEYTAPESQ